MPSKFDEQAREWLDHGQYVSVGRDFDNRMYSLSALLESVDRAAREEQHKATCEAFLEISDLYTTHTDAITEAYNRIAAAPPPDPQEKP